MKLLHRTIIFLLVLCIPLGTGFYIPGLSPKTFQYDEPVDLYVNKIFSDKTQLPFAYSDLPFVCPARKGGNRWLNLGEVLRGDRIELGPEKLKLNVGVNKECLVVCAKDLNAGESMRAKQLIKKDYRVEWIVDNLPGATAYPTADGKQRQYEVGFNLGQTEDKRNDKTAYLNNHFAIKILYEKKDNDPNGYLIVGFEVEPYSINALKNICPDKPENSKNEKLEVGNGSVSVTYSYSVEWIENKQVSWGNRWDLYLVNTDPQIHWYSIINSLIIALFLSAMVAIIMLRTLNKDIASYNEKDLKLEDQDDTTGWKLVHGDVFRPPKWGGFLAPLLGSGVQILLMGIFTMVFSILGVLNPSYRGGFLSFALFLFAFSAVFAGYYSSRMYKVFKGTAWKKNAVVTSILFPGFIFGVIFALNFFIWSQHSSSAIPFGTFFALISIWFFISLPLALIGAYFGYKKKIIEHPVRTNQIPRQIPESVWYLQPGVSIMIGGLMPFAVIFIELFFILKSIWQDQFYYMFGFLGLVFIILVVTVIEIAIVITYFQLCGENYHWWWRSFFVGGSSAIYIFLYSIFYFAKLQITGFIPTLVYFMYSFLASCVFGLLTGTLGFFGTYWFVRKIYSAIKAD
ncbi:hypothetical protein G9A89_002283 [Geosiphon pyriformis]|nr:hypothetical protein G9A89_002283 [Geosiphon pyriformis]